MDDVLLNKIAIIEKCVSRIEEEYSNNIDNLVLNYTKQDSMILNLQRACEAAIDLGTRISCLKKLGVPQSSRDVFHLLEKAKYISKELNQYLQHMVGFRNITVHEYQKVNLDIVQNIIEKRLKDFHLYIECVKKII